jgi:DNA-binding response OmpR family regulator
MWTGGAGRGTQELMRILLIEDEARIASFVKRGLEAEGFVVEHASDGLAGVERASALKPDLIILDLILPKLSGEVVLDLIRRSDPATPIIVLTAKDAVSDRVTNLQAGADDYLIKPFSFSELLARIRARLRDTDQLSATTIRFGDVTLDILKREAQYRNRRAELSSREMALLETLMRHPGQVLSQAQLLDQVWGYDHEPGSNVVEVYVGYLRRKLDAQLIETVRGAGYRLRA